MANEQTPVNEATPYTNANKGKNQAEQYKNQNEMTDPKEAFAMDDQSYGQDITPNDKQREIDTNRGESYDRVNDGNGMSSQKSNVQKNEERKNREEVVSGYMSQTPEEVELLGKEMKGYKSGEELNEKGMQPDSIQSTKQMIKDQDE